MAEPEFDAIVVGAGFAGLYMLHKLRTLGFSARVYEAGSDVGGTWYWNRYPGARCDVESMEYSYSFDEELEQQWTWTERYATQPEILAYLQHVAERFDLSRDIVFETRVGAASFDEDTNLWTVETEAGDAVTARHVIMATGCLSSANRPDIPGLEDFEGEIYQTALWPHEGVDFTGQKVAVIGTGSSAIQSIPVIAEQAERLTVFQRTPNYVVPANNHAMSEEYEQSFKRDYRTKRQEQRDAAFGILMGEPMEKLATEVSEEERERRFRELWDKGGLTFLGAFPDLILDEEANESAAEFIRARIREKVKDPKTADLLTPTDYPAGSKRLCVDTCYFETFNEDHVELVDLNTEPIERITASGIQSGGRSFDCDSIVLATGFDAMTGTLSRIAISGRKGETLKDKWAAGPRTYLGLMSEGFPNLFMITGPGSPSVLSNMIVSIEQHVDWIGDAMEELRERGAETLEPLPSAENQWVGHVNAAAEPTVMLQANSWYLGANVPGKPRIFMPYIGGVPTYRKICAHVAQEGYAGFAIDGEANDKPVAYDDFVEVPEALLSTIPTDETGAGDAAVAR